MIGRTKRIIRMIITIAIIKRLKRITVIRKEANSAKAMIRKAQIRMRIQ